MNANLYVPLKTNPEIVKILRDAVKNGAVVSKNPMVISSFHRENVWILDMVDGMVTKEHPSFNTYGASHNKIHMCIIAEDGLTIPKEIYEEMKTVTDIDEIYRRFGDSVERILWIKTLLDREEKVNS